MSSERALIPLLEFDPTREAFIEPGAWNREVEAPSACVVSWFSDAVERFVAEHRGRVLFENVWEDGPHPLYGVEFQGRPLTVIAMPVGAPAAAGLLEQAIANGCRSFVACGGAGALRPELTPGHLVVLSSAVRDEGTSHHYLPPGRTVDADPRAVAVLEAAGRARRPFRHRTGLDHRCLLPGDAGPDRQPAGRGLPGGGHGGGRAAGRGPVPGRAAGAGGLRRRRPVGVSWDHRDWTARHDVRDNLLRLAAVAALRLNATSG